MKMKSKKSLGPLSLDEYQVIAYKTRQPHDGKMPGLAFPLLGLFGETGTLLSALKKKQRDRKSYVGYRDAVVEELGDVLWYFSDIASQKSIRLSELAQTLFNSHRAQTGFKRQKTWKFENLRFKLRGIKSSESAAFEAALLDLASVVGLLVTDFKLGKLAGGRAELKNHLVKILDSMIKVADEAQIDLNEVAELNLKKTYARWPKKKIFHPLFDADCEIHFMKAPQFTGVKVINRINGHGRS